MDRIDKYNHKYNHKVSHKPNEGRYLQLTSAKDSYI